MNNTDRRLLNLAMDAMPAEAEPGALTWRVMQPGDDRYAQAASKAFTFFRQHADGRYSSRNLMRLANLADAAEDNPRTEGMPILLTAGTPWTYDEDTEQKRGGMVAMCVWWAVNGRCMLAVHADKRRQKVGTTLLRFVVTFLAGLGAPVFWVGRQNFSGQKFLLSNLLMPTALNSNGAVRYSAFTPDDEDAAEEVEITPARASARNQRLYTPPPREAATPWLDGDPEDDEPITYADAYAAASPW